MTHRDTLNTPFDSAEAPYAICASIRQTVAAETKRRSHICPHYPKQMALCSPPCVSMASTFLENQRAKLFSFCTVYLPCSTFMCTVQLDSAPNRSPRPSHHSFVPLLCPNTTHRHGHLKKGELHSSSLLQLALHIAL